MDWKLELIVLPVTDIDRSKVFYLEQLGFGLDVDHSAGEDFRVVQLTPEGSSCSVSLMKNPDRAGQVQGLHLIVEDIEAARGELLGRGLEIGEVFTSAREGRNRAPIPSAGTMAPSCPPPTPTGTPG